MFVKITVRLIPLARFYRKAINLPFHLTLHTVTVIVSDTHTGS